MIRIKYKLQTMVATAILLLIPTTLHSGLIEGINRDLEEWYLGLLAQVQSTAGVSIQSFTTDGCSGGLSEGWKSFARLLPGFKAKFGDKPPWEACCVAHDRTYWRGEVENGYDLRLQADKLLRQCVIEYGKKHSARIAKKFSSDEHRVLQQFQYAGDLMYQAVRIGGKPCSRLPWRWGYGWPYCKHLPQSNTP